MTTRFRLLRADVLHVTRRTEHYPSVTIGYRWVTPYRGVMAHHIPVPSDSEPTSIVDLVNDCREVAGLLSHSVIDLTSTVVRIPLGRLPLDRLPFSFGTMPVEITDDLLVTVSGMDDY